MYHLVGPWKIDPDSAEGILGEHAVIEEADRLGAGLTGVRVTTQRVTTQLTTILFSDAAHMLDLKYLVPLRWRRALVRGYCWPFRYPGLNASASKQSFRQRTMSCSPLIIDEP